MAVDRGDRAVGALLRVAWQEGFPVLTCAGVVAQAWRGGSAQARLARALAGIDVRALDHDGARHTGVLLGQSNTADVVDAHLALLVHAGDHVVTSDPDDILALLASRKVAATVVRV